MSDQLDEFWECARREMFPKMKESMLSVMIAPGGDPDPKICIELGAAILYDKPIVVLVPKGREVPLSLRTIATRIVETDEADPEGSQARLAQAIRATIDSLPFRGGGRGGQP